MVLVLLFSISHLSAQENVEQAKFREEALGGKSAITRRQAGPPRRFLVVDGEPFFAIGSYGPPSGTEELRGDPWKVIHENGWNCSIVNAWTADEGKTGLLLSERALKDMAHAANAFNHKFLLITESHWQLQALERPNSDEYVSVRPKLLDKRIEDIGGFPSDVRKSIIGFYHYDEPENMFAAGYRKERVPGQSIQEWILHKVGWEYDRLKSAFPDIPIVGIIAWEPSYPTLNVKGFCDINLPNSYPTWRRENSPTEFVTNHPNPPFESIPADARDAVKAATANGMPLPIYMPFGCSDSGIKTGRQGTLAEIRYQFFAPVTQGVMGVIYWASYRSDIEYAETTIFPATRALRDMTPFFVGHWIDDKILSYSPDAGSTEMAKKYGIPDVSCILRESEDGRVLLLAVNNTPDERAVTFQLDVKCNGGAEYFTGNRMEVSSGRIADTMPRYGVRAYLLKAEQ